MHDVKTLEDFVIYKYEDPDYGGTINVEFVEEREKMEMDIQPQLMFVDHYSNKIYNLWVHDVEIWVEGKDQINETFHITVRVSNLNSNDPKNEGKDFTVREISGYCYSPFKGKKRTQYSSVNCKFRGVDLSVFDNYPIV